MDLPKQVEKRTENGAFGKSQVENVHGESDLDPSDAFIYRPGWLTCFETFFSFQVLISLHESFRPFCSQKNSL